MDYNDNMLLAYNILEIVNLVIVIFCSLAFISQLFYFIFSWLKNKKLKDTNEFGKAIILICARNEGEIIYKTIDTIRKTIDYPLKNITFLVCCHNCTDDTKVEAEKAGAIAIELKDDNQKHAMVAYPQCFAYQYIKDNLYDNCDFIVKIDADNILDSKFLKEMNKAMKNGYKVCRGYIGASNLTQNNWALCSGIYYMRDSRISSRVREAMHLDSMLDGGASITISKDVLNDFEGQFLTTSAEDSEFTLKLLYKKYRIHYIEDAIVFDDQPSTFKDTFNRQIRIGHGLNVLYLKNFFKMIFYSIKNHRFSLIDLMLQLTFIPVSFFSIVWIIPYNVSIVIFHAFNAFLPNGVDFMVGFMSQADSFNKLLSIAISGISFVVLIVIMYVCETIITLKSARKRIDFDYKKAKKGIFIAPLFMLIYNLAIFTGIVTKPKWKKIRRNNIKKD